MPTHNQSTFAIYPSDRKNVVSYYKIVISMFQTYSDNPKPMPKTGFGSRCHKELTTIRNNETQAGRIDFEKVKSLNDRSTLEFLHDICNIFPAAFHIRIHCKKTLNASFDAKFTALRDYVTRIERVDFENPKKSEKKIWFQY